eukprot:TRINITY_DN1551_c0_g3_i1.p1 TRINITY_DN1551_c0_g3~~TRINITY_DN1551_c0_g3_i1.p1  ORF type:complete len:270 (-),score=90.60 TRINITY_DN1551_c0_g3_i1:16-825(-)
MRAREMVVVVMMVVVMMALFFSSNHVVTHTDSQTKKQKTKKQKTTKNKKKKTTIFSDGGESEGFQLWVNLAPEHKMIAPSYQDVPPERVPVHTRGAAEVRVLVGRSVLSAAGEAAAATTLSPVTLLDVAWAGAPAGAVHAERVEPGHEGFVYVYRGSVTVNGRTLVEGDCALLGPAASDDETEVIFSGTDGGRALLAAGLPVPGPIVRHGPFVMNTREQIEQCFADLEDGSFGKIEGTEDEARATAAAVAKQRETGTWDAQMRGDGPKK